MGSSLAKEISPHRRTLIRFRLMLVYVISKPLKVVHFVVNFLSFDHFNISRADIPYILGNGIGGAAARSMQPVTL